MELSVGDVRLTPKRLNSEALRNETVVGRREENLPLVLYFLRLLELFKLFLLKKRYASTFRLWLCWVFTAMRGLSLVVESEGYSGSLCGLLLWSTGSRAPGLRSCDSRA